MEESSDNEKDPDTYKTTARNSEKDPNENNDVIEEESLNNSPVKYENTSPDNSPLPKDDEKDKEDEEGGEAQNKVVDSLPLKKLKPTKKLDIVTYRNKVTGER